MASDLPRARIIREGAVSKPLGRKILLPEKRRTDPPTRTIERRIPTTKDLKKSPIALGIVAFIVIVILVVRFGSEKKVAIAAPVARDDKKLSQLAAYYQVSALSWKIPKFGGEVEKKENPIPAPVVEQAPVLAPPKVIGIVRRVPEPVDPMKGISRQVLADQVYRIIRRHASSKIDAHTLSRAIVEESARQNYDPLFVAAVIKSESTFNAMAKSVVGARGLMQVMPQTGSWIANTFEQFEGMAKRSLTDPGYNLKLGIAYLKHLESMFDGNRVFTLIAYNWGPGQVEKATDGKKKVPSEVVQYAIKILNDHRRWRSEVGLN